jgi:hypothetical protein
MFKSVFFGLQWLTDSGQFNGNLAAFQFNCFQLTECSPICESGPRKTKRNKAPWVVERSATNQVKHQAEEANVTSELRLSVTTNWCSKIHKREYTKRPDILDRKRNMTGLPLKEEVRNVTRGNVCTQEGARKERRRNSVGRQTDCYRHRHISQIYAKKINNGPLRVNPAST